MFLVEDRKIRKELPKAVNDEDTFSIAETVDSDCSQSQMNEHEEASNIKLEQEYHDDQFSDVSSVKDQHFQQESGFNQDHQSQDNTPNDSKEHSQEEKTSDPKQPRVEVHHINTLSSNHKIKLSMFKETDNCEAWVRKCEFIINLGGVKNAFKKISHMCSHLPEPIQETVILELAELEENQITIQEFIKTLNKACRKNEFQYETLFTKLKYNEEEHLNLRNFYYRVKQLVKQTIGEGCDKMVEKVAFKEFLNKLPQKIQKSEFLLEYRKEKTNLMDIVDKCEELYEKFRKGDYTEVNGMSHHKRGSKKPSQKFSRGFKNHRNLP
ncbi:Oidioi.mRNA.OKI2018_I69.YSR.g17192.t1.cds [Oikopleura dioica]|uniref:Oidioi.mRNA.OKI2018_I69.YSR.g17192.t1.cds n=1 Tax=Oikopleura dioica TaxID=34765 RepID=A0ABN7SIG5_OIKDI|nr:Oidioi.mRNA.OKI2018_I69.YSR.g17192.t1.cds [Oikopleura dioica]